MFAHFGGDFAIGFVARCQSHAWDHHRRRWHSALTLYILSAMTRETAIDSRQDILRTAARLFQQRGYDATSMNDVAAALKLSKGGLYHHFQSKDEILFNLMNHAMDITQERVIDEVKRV